MSGIFYQGKRNGKCVVKSEPKGIRKLEGTWTRDVLEGLVKIESIDGSVTEGWVSGTLTQNSYTGKSLIDVKRWNMEWSVQKVWA